MSKHAQHLGAEPAGEADGRQAEQGHERFDAWDGGQAEQRADRAAHSPAADQHEALAPIGKLVGELGRHAPAERMPDDGDPVDLEHTQEIAHPVGVAGDRVVGPGFLRASVPEQVRCDDRVVLRQALHDRPPRVGAVPDPVDEEDGRARTRLHVGPAVPVDRDVLHAERALAADAGPVADLRGIDRRGLGGTIARRVRLVRLVRRVGQRGQVGHVRQVSLLRRVAHADLPYRSAGWLVGPTVWGGRVRAVSTL